MSLTHKQRRRLLAEYQTAVDAIVQLRYAYPVRVRLGLPGVRCQRDSRFVVDLAENWGDTVLRPGLANFGPYLVLHARQLPVEEAPLPVSAWWEVAYFNFETLEADHPRRNAIYQAKRGFVVNHLTYTMLALSFQVAFDACVLATRQSLGLSSKPGQEQIDDAFAFLHSAETWCDR